ncbi:MAG: AraC family transcriptional regulator [Chloroflexi bacterium]|nr:AraC family transcriptional regulator [Chloroflexota bacterium]
MDRIKIPYNAISNIETFGISRVAVLQQAHLPLNLLQAQRPALTTGQWFALWHALGALSDDPALGLRIGSDAPVDRYDPVYIAGLCARSFREALNNVARYKQQFCSEELRMVERDGLWHIDVIWSASQEPTPSLLIDGMFASYIALGQRGSGHAVYPERVRFARKADHRKLYETYFHCPVDFGADSNEIIFSRPSMETSFRTFNPDMLALLVPQLESQLNADRSQPTLSHQVTALLQTRLPNQPARMQDIAQELNISPRTLQRQLAQEGTGFQQLLDAARHELAQSYLRASSLDLNEIAYLLGYEEANSFHRAFHQWEGMSPGQWRTTYQHRAERASAHS